MLRRDMTFVIENAAGLCHTFEAQTALDANDVDEQGRRMQVALTRTRRRLAMDDAGSNSPEEGSGRRGGSARKWLSPLRLRG